MKPSFALLFAGTLCLAVDCGAAILGGPLTNPANSHVYFLLSSNYAAAAEAEAVALGGHLMTVNDVAEQAWFSSVIAPLAGTNRVWIGLTDEAVEGTFGWINGETSVFRNWATGEPNNTSEISDFVHVYPTNDIRAGQWNDVRGIESYLAVAEILPGTVAETAIHPAVEIAWTSQTTNQYQVQWSSTLDSNNWFNLGPASIGTGTTNYFFDSTREGVGRYYRVLTLPP